MAHHFTTLTLERDSRDVVTLWLDRPERGNAFNAQMIAELNTALGDLQADEWVRLLLIRGRGRHFSAGADLAWMQASAKLDYAANLADAQALGELMSRLYHLPCPTLAVVHGGAYGGAVGLASCCDLAIGTSDCQFRLSEVRLGLLPAVISPYVVKAIGERAMRQYALGGQPFDGRRALELGLLSEVTAAADLDATVERWVSELLRNGPQALRACKALLLEVGDGRLSPELREHTETAIARIRVSAEGQEGLAAFLEKRDPAWTSFAEQTP